MCLYHHTYPERFFRDAVFEILFNIHNRQELLTQSQILLVHFVNLAALVYGLVRKRALPMIEQVRIEVVAVELVHERCIFPRNVCIPEVLAHHHSVLPFSERVVIRSPRSRLRLLDQKFL